jgi:hypothetical protein
VHFANVIADDGVSVNGKIEKPEVRFLGVWDVVAAFGIPINLGFNFNRINLGYKLGLSQGVKYCYHALALDESRPPFRPTRLRPGFEVWFRGVHSDVGGGNDNHALNDIALRWMLRKAIASGLPMASDCVDTSCTRADLHGKVSANFDPLHGRAREPKPDDWFHYSVAARPGLVNPSEPCTRESESHENEVWVRI